MTKKEIEYSNQARKFLDSQTQAVKERIINAIEGIFEGKGDIKKLHGREYKRLRVGIYRVIFDDSGLVLYVFRIKTRGDVYKGGKRK